MREGATVSKLWIVGLLVATVLVGACGSKPASYTSPTTTDATPRLPLQDLTGAIDPTKTTTIPPPPVTEAPPPPAGPEAGPDGQLGTADDLAPTTTVPSPQDAIAAEIAGVNDCVAITSAAARLYVQAMGGVIGVGKAAQRGAELKAMIPPQLHGSVDVIVDAIEATAQVGPLDSDAFEQPAYRAAETTLQNWITGGCGN